MEESIVYMRDYSKLDIQEILIHEINYFAMQGAVVRSITLGYNDYQELMRSFDGTSICEVGSIETSFHGISIRLAKKAENLIRVNTNRYVINRFIKQLLCKKIFPI